MCEFQSLYILFVPVYLLYRAWEPPEKHSEEVLVALLHVSDQFEIPAARKFALHYLNILHPPLSPTRKLELCRLYSIPASFTPDDDTPLPVEPSWPIEATLSFLLDVDLSTLNATSVNQLDSMTWFILTQALVLLNVERQLMASVPPPVDNIQPSYECFHHDRCQQTWTNRWIRCIGPRLTHPTDPVPFRSIIQFLRGADCFNSGGLNPGCLEAFIASMDSNGLPLGVALIVNAAATSISEHYQSL
jgi:hypothetical protein